MQDPGFSVADAWIALVLLALSSACGASTAIPDEIERFDEPTNATFDHGIPRIQARVAGVQGSFTVDTGAQATVVDTRAFPDLAATTPSGVARTDVYAFGRHFRDWPVVLIDFSESGWSGEGIIGADITSQFVLTIDYLGKQVWLQDARDPPAGLDAEVEGAGHEIALERGEKGWFFVRPTFDGVTADMLVDTGAAIVLGAKWLVDELGRDGRKKLEGGNLFYGTEREKGYELVRAHSVSLGGARAVQVPVHAPVDDRRPPHDSRGLLGTPFFQNFLFTLNGPRATLTLVPYVDPRYIDRYVRPGFSLTDVDGVWTVSGVFRGTQAEGVVMKGDVVERIDGVSLCPSDWGQLDSLFLGRDVGDRMELELVRSGSPLVVDAVVEDALPLVDAP